MNGTDNIFGNISGTTLVDASNVFIGAVSNVTQAYIEFWESISDYSQINSFKQFRIKTQFKDIKRLQVPISERENKRPTFWWQAWP